MSARPLITVIIPSCRALDCLRLSLPEFLKTPDCEMVIGVDGDNAAYRAFLDPLPVTVSVTQRRQGACTATNLAAAVASGEYLFLCNDDMVPAPGWDSELRRLAAPDRVVSGTCWEPGLIAVPPSHDRRDFGHDPARFRKDEFFGAARTEAAQAREYGEGINYPFLIPKVLWDTVGGLDERFNPGSASDPDLFIRLRLLDPQPGMIRSGRAIFYHFAGWSSVYAGGRISLSWKIHWKHGVRAFRHKWGRKWTHRFGDVPDDTAWRGVAAKPEPLIAGRLWRLLWFGRPGYTRRSGHAP